MQYMYEVAIAQFMESVADLDVSNATQREAMARVLHAVLDAAFRQRNLSASPEVAAAVLSALWPTPSVDDIMQKESPAVSYAGDIALAQACAAGAQAAIALFVDEFEPLVLQTLQRMRFDEATCRDIAQDIMGKLLSGAPAKIATYQGRALLRTWVRAVATREAISRKRKVGEIASDDEILAQLPASADDGTALIRERYGAEFKAAFGEAMAALVAEERILVRSYYIDGYSVEEISRINNVHKSTISRRLSNIRLALEERLISAFTARVRVSTSEALSIMRGLQNELELSLSRLTQFAS